jgi:outer membrane protein OmpA-like peptidoglycan-associated protein
MVIAICLFLLGAGAGAFLAFRNFVKGRMPGSVAVAHGLAGAAGFSILLFVCMRDSSFAPARYALAVLVGAIGLGCVNIVYHLRRARHRSALIVAHALLAVVGVGILSYGAFVQGATARSPQAAPAEDATRSRLVAAAAQQPLPLAGPAPAAPGETSPRHRPGWAWTDRTITFARESTTPSDASMVEIAQIAADINQDEGIRLIEVQGHADERGTEGDNVYLTRARARAVVDALVANSVDAGRLKSAGLGARCPVNPACQRPGAPRECHEESSWQQDRRVVFLVLESGAERYRGRVACERAADLIGDDDRKYDAAAGAQAAR